MKPKAKEDYKRRAKDCLKKLLLRLNDYSSNYPDNFNKFLEEPDVKMNLKMLQAYLKD